MIQYNMVRCRLCKKPFDLGYDWFFAYTRDLPIHHSNFEAPVVVICADCYRRIYSLTVPNNRTNYGENHS